MHLSILSLKRVCFVFNPSQVIFHGGPTTKSAEGMFDIDFCSFTPHQGHLCERKYCTAYIKCEWNHLYEYSLHKMRTTHINSSWLVCGCTSPMMIQFVLVPGVICSNGSSEQKLKNRLALFRKIAIFYSVFFISNQHFSQDKCWAVAKLVWKP